MFDLDQWCGEPLPDETFTADELATAEFITYPDYLFDETSADVIAARATVNGFGVETLGPLLAVPFAELSDTGRLNALQCLTGYSAYVESLKTELIALNAGPRPVDKHALEDDFISHEIAVATKCSVYAADRKVALSRDLVIRLAATATAMRNGEVSYEQAQHLSEETRYLPLDVARAVERDVLRFAWRQDIVLYRASVRRALARRDPEWAPRAKHARQDATVEHTPNSDGTGNLFIRGPLEITAQLNLILNAYASKTKSDLGGTAAQRKLAGLRYLADMYLGSGQAPLHHGRLPIINVTIDAATLLGLANHPAEIPGVGLVPADVAKWLLADGAPLRRLLIDGTSGALLDYGTKTYVVPPPLADFLCARNVKSASPHSNVDSRVSDMEHNTPNDKGGGTDPVNNSPVDRRWHRAKTHGDWVYTKELRSGVVTWFSPNGLSYRVEPHDYRLGP